MKHTTEELLLAHAVLQRAVKLRHETAMQTSDPDSAREQPIGPFLEEAMLDIENAANFIGQRESSQA